MVLLIDGNYFAQRVRNGCELDFLKDPSGDKVKLIEAAATSLASEIRNLAGVIDHVIITRDHRSWRKKVEPIQPTHPMERVKGQSYKANRDELVKDYDPEAFYAAYDSFCDMCESKLNIPVFKIEGGEADDIIFILSKIFEKNNREVLCWSSDGDYLHIITEKVFYLKFPKRDLHLPNGLGTKTPKTMMDVFNNAAPKRSKLLMESFTEDSIKETNPAHSLLVKCVYGDEKDNVPPIFTWWSKNHKVQYRPSENKIKKAIEAVDLNWDTLKKDLLYDEADMKTFLKALIPICGKDLEIDLDHAYNVFVSNRKLKHLNEKEIPKDLIQGVVQIFKDKASIRPNLDICSDYQKMLQAFGQIEAGSYFSGLNLES